ncbi:MAG: NAD(P)H-dependent oxidoreductase subunit E [Desulfobacteraceae bacterium]|jgi:NADH:ubiquinone oxidoreductase subunit E|nr:NAD(P)H-dependent oxidoreductase subunit E [Desulfobacteraceae bacterium]
MKKRDILEKYPPRMENILLILHDLQKSSRMNYLSEKDLSLVANHLNTTLGWVCGVASYYAMFSLRPRGRHIIRICRSPVCHCAGVNDVFNELSRVLQIDVGATTPDRLFTLETTACLGQCDLAPAMTIDDITYGNLTAASIATLIGKYRNKGASQGD